MQLTSLRPTADLFCSLLRDVLKIELQKGQMKAVKGFAKTCFSETLIAESTVEAEDGAGDMDKDAVGDEIAYHGGLGLKFKFPGDPKKCVLSPLFNPVALDAPFNRLREASKLKLWTTYLKGTCSYYSHHFCSLFNGLHSPRS